MDKKKEIYKHKNKRYIQPSCIIYTYIHMYMPFKLFLKSLDFSALLVQPTA